MHLNYAIVFASDMKRSVSFYRDVLGLPLRFESPGWTEFATEGATLPLHLEKSPAAADENPKDETPGSCRPGLGVPDLDAFHQRMVEHGVPCVQEPRELFGARQAQYVNPDGLTISLAEQPA